MGLYDDDGEQENSENGDSNTTNYSYLLNDPEFTAEFTDFSDPSALARR